MSIDVLPTAKPAPARLSYHTLAPTPMELMLGLEAYFETCGLETTLVELVKMRASQINGCAYCIDMHSKDARALGEREQRLYALNAWRETPFFTPRERAALAWTEAVTQIAVDHAPDAVYAEARRYFDEKELVDLTWVITTINAWNRMAVATRAPVGGYRSAKRQPAATA